jgi:hypothetical protein
LTQLAAIVGSLHTQMPKLLQPPAFWRLTLACLARDCKLCFGCIKSTTFNLESLLVFFYITVFANAKNYGNIMFFR